MTKRARSIETIDLPEVESWDDVPKFETEAEEAEFWSTHGLGKGMLGDLETETESPSGGSRRAVDLMLDADTIARLKALARKKHKGYQTLLKEFVMERLYEEEKRERLIG